VLLRNRASGNIAVIADDCGRGIISNDEMEIIGFATLKKNQLALQPYELSCYTGVSKSTVLITN
jgi:hypothetical protein